jgi:hypothetical protein
MSIEETTRRLADLLTEIKQIQKGDAYEQFVKDVEGDILADAASQVEYTLSILNDDYGI